RGDVAGAAAPQAEQDRDDVEHRGRVPGLGLQIDGEDERDERPGCQAGAEQLFHPCESEGHAWFRTALRKACALSRRGSEPTALRPAEALVTTVRLQDVRHIDRGLRSTPGTLRHP